MFFYCSFNVDSMNKKGLFIVFLLRIRDFNNRGNLTWHFVSLFSLCQLNHLTKQPKVQRKNCGSKRKFVFLSTLQISVRRHSSGNTFYFVIVLSSHSLVFQIISFPLCIFFLCIYCLILTSNWKSFIEPINCLTDKMKKRIHRQIKWN